MQHLLVDADLHRVIALSASPLRLRRSERALREIQQRGLQFPLMANSPAFRAEQSTARHGNGGAGGNADSAGGTNGAGGATHGSGGGGNGEFVTGGVSISGGSNTGRETGLGSTGTRPARQIEFESGAFV